MKTILEAFTLAKRWKYPKDLNFQYIIPCIRQNRGDQVKKQEDSKNIKIAVREFI